jgi:hypothetical protein
MSESGEMRFQNAAEETGVAKPAGRYTIAWARFDNDNGTVTPVASEQTVTSASVQAPRELLSEQFVAATIRAFNRDQPAWQDPLVVYFRRAVDGKWSLVGLERNPEH